MQRKLLQSHDYCRAVNTMKGLLWIGSTMWKSIWQEHKSWCVCELSCTDSSCSAFQHKASFLLQWKTCKLLAALQSHSADTQLGSPGSYYRACPSTGVASQQWLTRFPLQVNVAFFQNKTTIQKHVVTNMCDMCRTENPSCDQLDSHIHNAMFQSGHPLRKFYYF